MPIVCELIITEGQMRIQVIPMIAFVFTVASVLSRSPLRCLHPGWSLCHCCAWPRHLHGVSKMDHTIVFFSVLHGVFILLTRLLCDGHLCSVSTKRAES